MPDPIGEFSFESTGTTFTASDDGFQSLANFEGTATGYGTVAGTLAMRADAADATLGAARWVGQGFLEDGSTVAGVGDGSWRQSGHHKWAINMDVEISNGDRVRIEGEVDLASRSYKGTFFEAG